MAKLPSTSAVSVGATHQASRRSVAPTPRSCKSRSDVVIASPRPWFASLPPPISGVRPAPRRSEEHTSELQSRENLVCRLLLEKKKKKGSTTVQYSRYLIV